MEGEGASAQSSLWSQCFAKMKGELKSEVIEEVLKALAEKNDTINVIEPGTKLDSSPNAGEHKVQLHHEVFCDLCDKEISGVRYKCGNCIDFDLCEKCEQIPDVHNPYHIFLKIRHPQCEVLTALQVKDYINDFKRFPRCNLPNLLQGLKMQDTVTSSVPASSEYLVRVISDVTTPENSVFDPNVKFVKTWRIQNVGSKPWNVNTVLKYVHGYWNSAQTVAEVAAPQLSPFQEGVISVPFVSPSHPGSYEAYWQLHHNGQPFMELLQCCILVGPSPNHSSRVFHVKSVRSSSKKSEHSSKKSDHLNTVDFALPTLGPIRSRRKSKEEKRKKKDYRTKDVKDIVDVLNAVQGEHGVRHGPRLVAASSSTATPNNTPFDLSPPKSPEPHDILQMKEALSEVSSNDRHSKDHDNFKTEDVEDKTPSVISISSSESDSEFVVIPMPDCFNFTCGQFFTKSSSEPTLNDQIEGQNNLSKTQICVQEIIAENVSQETGAPEEAENFNIQSSVQMKEDSDDNEISMLVYVDSPDANATKLLITLDTPASIDGQTTTTTTTISDSGSATSSPQAILPIKNNTTSQQTITTPPPISDHLNQSSSTLSSATFPKFPLQETVENNAEISHNVEQDERTIQVLPEGLVTGALLAAASVYNTAKTVISSIQRGKNEQEDETSSSVSNITPLSPAEQLIEMGFYNREQNERLLQKHNGNVPVVVAELVSLNDNDWYATRHSVNPHD